MIRAPAIHFFIICTDRMPPIEAIIIKKLSEKVRMPVTEHNSTVTIAFLMRKYCKRI